MGRSEIDGGKIGGSPPTPEGMRIKFGERVTEEGRRPPCFSSSVPPAAAAPASCCVRASSTFFSFAAAASSTTASSTGLRSRGPGGATKAAPRPPLRPSRWWARGHKQCGTSVPM